MHPPTLPRSDAPTDFSARLLPLSDGRPGLRGTMPVEVREPSPLTEHGPRNTPPSNLRENSCNSCEASGPVLDFISSDETLDRYSEIISAAGWKLDSYQRNPVFQNAHQYGDVIFTLGRALITELRSYPRPSDGRGAGGEGKVLFQRIQFATDVNPMAKIAYGLYRGKFLNAVSVGFIPLRWENADGTEHSVGRSLLPAHSLSSSGGEGQGEEAISFRSPHSELRTPQPRRRYLEQELLEVSAVAIPANPNALALGLKSGAIEKSDLRDLADLLRLTLDHQAAAAASLSPRERAGVKGNSAPEVDQHQLSTPNPQLLQTARSLRDILKHL